MDRGALDRYLTTDPRDDGYDCHDRFGTPYYQHHWPADGGSCRRCDAEPDPELEPDETESPA